MSDTPWMDKWKRSPRQDRRVIVNGRFVELTEPIIPEVKEEPVESALEIVHEVAPVHETVNTGEIVNAVSGTEYEEGRYVENEKDDVDKAMDFLQLPSIPPEALQFIEIAQKASESITRVLSESEKLQEQLEPLSAAVEPTAVLPATSENTTGADVLDGQTGRTEEAESEPMTSTTEVGGGYTAIEVDRS